MPFVFHYLWWSHAALLTDLSFPPRCWELCTACSRAETLHCSLNQQFLHSRASFFPIFTQSARARFDDIITAVTLIVDRPLWVKARHGLLHMCLPPHSPSPTARRWSVRRYKSLQRRSAAADYSWWLHLNHIQFNFLLSPRCHATLAVKYSTSGCLSGHRHLPRAGKHRHRRALAKSTFVQLNIKEGIFK